jgi:hypothetical protein
MLLTILIGLSFLLSACAAEDHDQTDDTEPTQTDANTLPIGQTGDNILPADLIFTATSGSDAYRSLLRVDAQTLQTAPFYVDDSAYIRALNWSPTGGLLAILRWSDSNDYLEICLLTRGGVLQSCFEDRITDHNFRERGQNYTLTWSEDGRYVYFVTDYDQFHWNEFTSDDWGASLVKADVATGQSQQVLYQPQVVVHKPPPVLLWADALHYLLLYRGRNTSATIDLWQNTEIPLPLDLPSLGKLEFCPQFSPQGQYLTARASLNEALSGWALVTPEGQIVQTVGSERLQQAGIDWTECPVWLSDEAAFYFLGGLQDGVNLFKYVLADDTIVKVKQLYPPDPPNLAFTGLYPQMPMRLAPDDATLAISFRVAGAGSTEIRILGPTNEWLAYGGDEAPIPVGADPIWFPMDDPD